MIHLGGYHEYHGGVQYHRGTQITKDLPPMILNTPTVLMISPTCLMIPPTVLSILHGTQDSPHSIQDIPHGTEHPIQYSRYPSHLS